MQIKLVKQNNQETDTSTAVGGSWENDASQAITNG